MLKYEVHGSGEPLVLVHGLTHRRQAWYPVLDHLTDHREVILSPYQARLATRRMPQATHVSLPGCGHVPMADDPARVAEVLLAGSRPVVAVVGA